MYQPIVKSIWEEELTLKKQSPPGTVPCTLPLCVDRPAVVGQL